MRPDFPLGVKRMISVESVSPFLNALERHDCTISRPGTVCSIRPRSAPPKALKLDPGREPMATFAPVMEPCAFGLRYIAYSAFAGAGRTTDCLTSLGMGFSFAVTAMRARAGRDSRSSRAGGGRAPRRRRTARA